MASVRTAAGVVVTPASTVIEVRVAELRQLFNAIDPSPFHERDLDPRAEAFIVDAVSISPVMFLTVEPDTVVLTSAGRFGSRLTIDT